MAEPWEIAASIAVLLGMRQCQINVGNFSADVEVTSFMLVTLDVSPTRNMQGCALGGVAATTGYHPPSCQLHYLYNTLTRILSFNMQHYQYAPLDRESDTIRLLRLLPSEVDKAEIRVELLEYDLRHSQQSLHSYEAFSYFLRHSQQSRHSYEALSYVWGGLETTQSILIGDEELRITSNLHAALLRLRDVTFPRILWVDAVCINQSDDPEKELQIQSMAMIYGFAKRTIVWLGEETEGSDIALEAIRFAGNKRDSIFNDNNGSSGRAGADEGYVRNAIASLLQREWFERIWVKQQQCNPNSV
ncbi:hypothetical protein SNOG_10103 [Parastagonospora nodorum SN15]|uniref:Heterokaryon incompatibility domain-containing protein n=1 Tax=Phaeosphaeria nodorum (strain SN15 / ATCC MYA-4574 / FGSC 10173) TaxID=321614 RepID=Q0UDR1_PHANO|nr:hypothetical protein SNOG_10103 [Parastagonospora nodorum SN15]EAT82438.1 hypothetical protein SNOG_10103 [Parastagonospora nodorum SN15]